MIEKVCPYCHNKFMTWPARIRQGKGIYCSMPCAALFHKEHKTGGSINLYKKGHTNFNTGKTHFTSARMKGRKLSAEHIRKVSEALTGVPRLERRGVNCPRWKGGITEENKKLRTSLEFVKWRNDVFSRDDYTCQICGKKGGVLNAHHIKKFSEYPSLRFVVKNGVTVCKDCHKIADEISRIINILERG